MRIAGNQASIGQLVNALRSQLDRPLIDATGLTKPFDFTLTFSQTRPTLDSSPDERAGASIFVALDQQLGLKLEKGTDLIDVFVIDHAEKTPVEK
jgi:uncharacterized protein (TIGR03435 family)